MKLVISVLLMLVGCHTSELRVLQAEHELDASRMDDFRAEHELNAARLDEMKSEVSHLAPCQPTK
jgi:hypothetical protein